MFGNLIAATRPHEIDTSSRSPRIRIKRDVAEKRPLQLTAGVRPEREKGQRVRINISGQIFETYKSTLTSKDGSIFKLAGISKMFDQFRNEYFFQRDSKAFEGVLVYMQCGVSAKPDKVSYKVFIEELQYFGFGQVALKMYKDKCVGYQQKRYDINDIKSLRGYIWHVLEYPRINNISKGLTLLSTIIIITSTSLICIESIPAVRHYSKGSGVIHNIECFCFGWFTLETCARFLTCSSLKHFFTNPVNIVDLLSVVPVCVMMAAQAGRHVFLASVIRVLRITRMIPAFGSEKFVRIFNTIMITVASSAKEFGCFLSLLIFMIILFSCLLYSVENSASHFNEDFSSVPRNVWFCVVTITSVGYGDIAPTTVGGKLVTSVMFGATILILSLPIPIIISNFLRAHDMLVKDCSIEKFYYDHEKTNEVERILPYLGTMEKDIDSLPYLGSKENDVDSSSLDSSSEDELQEM